MSRRSNAMPVPKSRPVTPRLCEIMAEIYPEQAEMWNKKAQELRAKTEVKG